MICIGFIGAGNIALALVRAITAKGLASRVNVFDIRRERNELFQREFPEVEILGGAPEVVQHSEVVILAVKPQDIDPLLREIAHTTGLIISIAAGITLQRLEETLLHARVVRVMPNTPCVVGEMAAGLALGSRVGPEDEKLVKSLLGTAGYVAPLEEGLLDAVTGLSGSGPAFVARLIQAFVAAGVGVGLPESVSRELTLQTFRGTAVLLQETSISPEELVRMVSSPQGTTLEGRKILDYSDVKEVIRQTVAAATRRSRELGAGSALRDAGR